MKLSVISLLPLLQLVSTLPQFNFSPEEYSALKIALYNNKPMYLTGAVMPAMNLLTIKNVKSDKNFWFDQVKNLISPDSKIHAFKLRKHMKKLLSPIYRSDVITMKPISKRRLVNEMDNHIRKKRQTSSDVAGSTDDEAEEPTVYAEELGFGLSTAGGVLGGALGGYLDTTGQATIKLIKSLENLGLLAIGQIDMAMDQQEERKRKEQEERRKQKEQNNLYGRT